MLSFLIHAYLSQSITALTRTAAASYGYKRSAPHDSKYDGTSNWELLSHGAEFFSPRHSHATTVFKCPDSSSKRCLWVTGGYSELHRTWDLELENENCDVWYSEDGDTWTQVTELQGDFLQGIGNWDAKTSSSVAPWYSRYGHSLDALDGDGDGIVDAMVLVGGNSPLPSNDVWISLTGKDWKFDGFAPFSKRAYHGSAVYQNKLYVMGGTPLNNEVWVGSLNKDHRGYTMSWSQESEVGWSPRAGMCAVSQSLNVNITDVTQIERLFIIGGFAEHDDGFRTRNDVWMTQDGMNWEQVHPPNNETSMPWKGRAFHACTTWSSLTDNSRWVADDSLMHTHKKEIFTHHTAPRIFLTGGGYMGTKENHEVKTLEAYTDTWWSSDGKTWNRVNYEEGSRYKGNIYSTNEWTETELGGKTNYHGKWGHTLEAFYTTQDIDLDGKIAVSSVSRNICTETNSPVCKRISAVEDKIPALVVIGGKLDGAASGSGPMVNDVFVSRQGLLCELSGITCGNHGECGPATLGCVCSGNFTGEYCTERIR